MMGSSMVKSRGSHLRDPNFLFYPKRKKERIDANVQRFLSSNGSIAPGRRLVRRPLHGLLVFAGSQAINAVFALSVVALYFAHAIPIAAHFVATIKMM